MYRNINRKIFHIKDENIISEQKEENSFDSDENNDKNKTILDSKEDISISNLNNNCIEKDRDRKEFYAKGKWCGFNG